MVTKKSAGFTLIEITLAMVISSSLALIALAGFSGLRGRAEFTNAIDGLKEQVTAVRTEAYTTVNLVGSGNSGQIIIGRMLTFTPGSSSVTVKTITASNTLPPTVVGPLVTERTISIPWNVTYNGPVANGPINVAFVRSAFDGTNLTSVGLVSSWGATPTYAQLSTVSASDTILPFKDLSGRNATLTITPSINGVTRAYQ